MEKSDVGSKHHVEMWEAINEFCSAKGTEQKINAVCKVENAFVRRHESLLRTQVAELEKDRERLDFMLVEEVRIVWSMSDQAHYVVTTDGRVIGGAYGKKAAIDAAMCAEVWE